MRPRVALLFILTLLLAACRVEPPPANGWGIVAADPKTGDVGVTAAACEDYPLDYRAVLVPDRGAGVALGISSPLQRDRLAQWIAEPLPAPQVITRLTDSSNDSDAELRQYGVVTLQGGSAQAAGFTGTQIAAPAGNLEDAANAVTVVGGALANPDALQAALDAYREPAASSLPLPDHLLRALEAVSAANGVALCNQNGITQTASTAFILVAHSGDSAFRTMTLGVPAQKEAQPPWLALSVKLPRGGRNAVGVLREEYEQWRPAHLPPCVECNLAPIAVPAGGTLTTPPNAWVQTNGLCLITVFILVIALLTTLWFTLRPHPAPRAPLSPDA